MPKATGTIRLTLLVSALAVATPAPARDVPSEYWLGLVDRYGIRKEVPDEMDLDTNPRFSLVGWRGLVIVPDVRTCAASGRIIFGEAESGWYVLAVAHSVFEQDPPLIFEDEQAWRAKLTELGVPKSIALLDPDRAAATRPARELRPSDYVLLDGALGLTDEDWQGLYLLALMAATLALNIARPTLGTAIWTVLLFGGIGFVVTFVFPWPRFDDPGLAPCGVPLGMILPAVIGQTIRSVWTDLFRRPTAEESAEFIAAPPRGTDDEDIKDDGAMNDGGDMQPVNEPNEAAPMGNNQDVPGA